MSGKDPSTVGQFLKRLSNSGVLPAADVSAVVRTVSPEELEEDAQRFARKLVRESTLTLYQATQLYNGKAAGLVLGNYVLLDKIGAGGMGMVFRARHQKMKRIVALKVLTGTAVNSAGAVTRFHREVEAAAKLSHPNIVTAHDADEAKGLHYLVMEHVDGPDLEQRVLESGPIPTATAMDYITQAATGLAHAHAHGVIHRDLKPSNLLLDPGGTIKILDMGLAFFTAEPGLQRPDNDLTRLTDAGSMVGTVDFMSPEQALDAREVDARSDVYSLGCTLYFLLTGQPVYQGETPMRRLIAHREAPIPSLSEERDDVPPQVDVILAKMIAKQPDDRYQTAEELRGDLKQWREKALSDRPSPDAVDDNTLPPDVLSEILGDD